MDIVVVSSEDHFGSMSSVCVCVRERDRERDREREGVFSKATKTFYWGG